MGERVIRILMRRDGMSYEEAKELVNETRELLQEAANHGDYDAAQDIMEDELGLEPDYIFDLI